MECKSKKSMCKRCSLWYEGNFQGQLQKCDPGQNAQERGQLQVYQKPGDEEDDDDDTTDMKELITEWSMLLWNLL